MSLQHRVTQMHAELVHDAATDLGEGVIWSPQDDVLVWIDVKSGELFRHGHSDGPRSRKRFDATIGSVAPRRDGGWVMGLGRDVVLVDRDDEIVGRIELPGVPATHRTNDGAVDPAGRLFQGTMALSEQGAEASLFRVDPDRSVRTVVDGVSISNGIGWSPDDSLMYYVDSPTYRVDVFDFEADSGEISDRRPLVEFDGSHGGPDGMTVDSDGCLWVAFFGGGCVRRYSPAGELLDIVSVDAPHTTSCAFGGPDLDTLYITTARHLLDPHLVEAHPLSGGLFAADVDATGVPTNLFAA